MDHGALGKMPRRKKIAAQTFGFFLFFFLFSFFVFVAREFSPRTNTHAKTFPQT